MLSQAAHQCFGMIFYLATGVLYLLKFFVFVKISLILTFMNEWLLSPVM